MIQTSHDLIVSDEGGNSRPKSPPHTRLLVTSVRFTQVPYVYFCSSVKPKLSARICQVCGLYNASNKSTDHYRKNIHGSVVQGVSQWRVRSMSIAARCANELMHILRALNGDEYAEWLEKEKMEEQGLESSTIPAHRSSENIIIYNVEIWIQGSWTAR